MDNVLKKQTESLELLSKNSEHDKIIQLSQLAYERKLDIDEKKNADAIIVELRDINGNIKKGFDTNTKKISDVFKKSIGFSAAGVDKVSEAAGKSREYRSIKERIRDKVLGRDAYDQNSLKYKFGTLRGFANTVGLVKSDSTGVFGDMLAKREEKQRYIDDALRLNPQEKNMKQYGGDESKVRAKYAAQFDQSVSLRKTLQGQDRELSGLRSRGLSDEEISRTTGGKRLLSARAKTATELGQTDFRFKGLAKAEGGTNKPSGVPTNTGKILPFTKEDKLEEDKIESQQTELLAQIEENTRKEPSKVKKEDDKEQKSFLGSLFDAITGALKNGLSMLWSGAKWAGSAALGGAKALGRAGTSALNKLGSSGAGKMLGRVAAVAGGLYEGYTAWNEADEKVKKGEITEREGTVLKGGAVGKGIGTTGGALAGGKLGAMIGTMILPGVGTAVGGILGGIIGGLAGGKFGDAVGKLVTEGALKIKDAVSEYIVKPLTEMYDKVSGLFKEYILEPLANVFEPVTNFFKDIKEKVFGWFENFEIPGISFSIMGKDFGVGPWRPFKTEQKETGKSQPLPEGVKPSTAGNGRGGAEFAATDPRRLDVAPQSSVNMTVANKPVGGNVITEASKTNEEARLANQSTGGGGNTVISAPTVNNTTKQTSVVKLPVRNQENTLNRYLSNRYV